MKTKKNQDIIDRLANLQKQIMHERPPLEKMRTEVQMMHFKIRPIQGNIALLNLNNSQLIEILWNLGKLEEFYNHEVRQISRSKRPAFFQLFDRIYGQLQNRLNRLNLKQEKSIKGNGMLELEIFKEKPRVN